MSQPSQGFDATPSPPPFDLDHLEAHVGRDIGVSPWLTVGQDAIDGFGRVTLDPDPNHIDPVWAARHSPFGGAVAFGFQTLAYLTYLGKAAGMVPAGVTDEVNYGLDRVRFSEPVPAGARIRARIALKSVRRRAKGAALATYSVIIEVEGRPKPALVADWLTLFYGGRRNHG